MTIAPPLEGCRVLVVEDDYLIADELSHCLMDQGAEVIGPLGQFDDALRQVRHDGFDIAVLDINLHGEKAFPIADELQRQGVPFVWATAYGAREIPDRFAAVPLWEKPYDERALTEDVRRLCEGCRTA